MRKTSSNEYMTGFRWEDYVLHCCACAAVNKLAVSEMLFYWPDFA